METPSLNVPREKSVFKEGHSPVAANRGLEASRYALLQRLAPGVRHRVAGTFQPIMMLASVMQKMAQAPNADLAKIGAHCASMYNITHSGAANSLECFSWFSTTEHVEIGINDGVSECLGLIATELALREFTIINDLTMCTAIWPRGALHNAFIAALLALTDATLSPAELVLSSEPVEKGLVLTLEVHSTNDAIAHNSVPIYRKIEWLDVELLAEAEGVSLERTPNGARLTLIAGGG